MMRTLRALASTVPPCPAPARGVRGLVPLALCRLALTAAAPLALLAGSTGAASAEELECLIEPKVKVALSTPVEGVIDKVHVDRGDFVEKGQVLVELESGVERATLEMAKARVDAEAELVSSQVNLDYAERSLARQQELIRTEVISQQDLDESLSNRELAEAGLRRAKEQKRLERLELERARAALALRTIRSPIDGVVIKRLFSPGEFADTRAILELAQIDPLHVEVFAPVSMLGRVSPGLSAEVILEEPVGGSHAAKVTVVDPVIDAASGTFGVRLELPNPDHALPAGLNCRVRFPEGEPAASARPDKAADDAAAAPRAEPQRASQQAAPSRQR